VGKKKGGISIMRWERKKRDNHTGKERGSYFIRGVKVLPRRVKSFEKRGPILLIGLRGNTFR